MHILDGAFPPGTEAAVAQAFVRAGARTSAAARPLLELGVAHSPGARTLIRRELLREAAPGAGRYYLGVSHYQRCQRRQQRRQVLVLLGLVALGVAAAVAIARGV